MPPKPKYDMMQVWHLHQSGVRVEKIVQITRVPLSTIYRYLADIRDAQTVLDAAESESKKRFRCVLTIERGGDAETVEDTVMTEVLTKLR